MTSEAPFQMLILQGNEQKDDNSSWIILSDNADKTQCNTKRLIAEWRAF